MNNEAELMMRCAKTIVEKINSILKSNEFKSLDESALKSIISNVSNKSFSNVIQNEKKFFDADDAYNCASARENLNTIKEMMQDNIDLIDEILNS